MKLQTNTTINGNVVFKKGKVGVYEVYATDYLGVDSDDDVTLYFVDSHGEVFGTIEVEADMGQGCGYIADVKVKGAA